MNNDKFKDHPNLEQHEPPGDIQPDTQSPLDAFWVDYDRRLAEIAKLHAQPSVLTTKQREDLQSLLEVYEEEYEEFLLHDEDEHDLDTMLYQPSEYLVAAREHLNDFVNMLPTPQHTAEADDITRKTIEAITQSELTPPRLGQKEFYSEYFKVSDQLWPIEDARLNALPNAVTMEEFVAAQDEVQLAALKIAADKTLDMLVQQRQSENERQPVSVVPEQPPETPIRKVSGHEQKLLSDNEAKWIDQVVGYFRPDPTLDMDDNWAVTKRMTEQKCGSRGLATFLNIINEDKYAEAVDRIFIGCREFGITPSTVYQPYGLDKKYQIWQERDQRAEPAPQPKAEPESGSTPRPERPPAETYSMEQGGATVDLWRATREREVINAQEGYVPSLTPWLGTPWPGDREWPFVERTGETLAGTVVNNDKSNDDSNLERYEQRRQTSLDLQYQIDTFWEDYDQRLAEIPINTPPSVLTTDQKDDLQFLLDAYKEAHDEFLLDDEDEHDPDTMLYQTGESRLGERLNIAYENLNDFVSLLPTPHHTAEAEDITDKALEVIRQLHFTPPIRPGNDEFYREYFKIKDQLWPVEAARLNALPNSGTMEEFMAAQNAVKLAALKSAADKTLDMLARQSKAEAELQPASSVPEQPPEMPIRKVSGHEQKLLSDGEAKLIDRVIGYFRPDPTLDLDDNWAIHKRMTEQKCGQRELRWFLNTMKEEKFTEAIDRYYIGCREFGVSPSSVYQPYGLSKKYQIWQERDKRAEREPAPQTHPEVGAEAEPESGSAPRPEHPSAVTYSMGQGGATIDSWQATREQEVINAQEGYVPPVTFWPDDREWLFMEREDEGILDDEDELDMPPPMSAEERQKYIDWGLDPDGSPTDWTGYIPELNDMSADHVLHDLLAAPMIDPHSPLLDDNRYNCPRDGVRMADLINEAWDSQKKQGRELTSSAQKEPIVESPVMQLFRERMEEQEAKLSPKQRSEMNKREQVLKTSFQKNTEPGHEPDGGREI